MRIIPCLAAVLALCSCNGPVSGDKAVGAGTASVRQSGGTAASDVFVMRVPPNDRTVALARFEGAPAVENGCLIFRMGDRRYLLGVAAGTAVVFDGQRVRIGERALVLGERLVLSGSQIDAGDIPESGAKPPPACDFAILRIV